MIAIIAILAGMLLPALGQIKGVAASVFCMSNLKQFSTLSQRFEQEHGFYIPYVAKTYGKYPHFADPTKYADGGMPIYYAKKGNVIYNALSNNGKINMLSQFICPEIPKGGIPIAGNSNNQNFNDHLFYMVNSPYAPVSADGLDVKLTSANTNFNGETARQWHSNSLKKPSGVGQAYDYGGNIYLGSYLHYMPGCKNFMYSFNGEWYTGDFVERDKVKGRHNSTINTSFYDGHVTKLKSGTSKEAYNFVTWWISGRKG